MELFAKYELKPIRASEQVYNILRSAIMKGELKAGETLIVSQLASALNTSRTPLREAIQRLEAEGWVKRQLNGTVVVSEVSLKKLKDFYAVRAVLEGLATREATLEMSDEEIRNIEKHLTEFSTIVNDNNTTKLAFLGEKIHSLIHEAAKNEVCKQLLSEINDQLARYRLYTTSSPGRSKEALKEHMEIIKFMRERKADEAEAAMRRHVLAAMRRHVLRAGEKFAEE